MGVDMELEFEKYCKVGGSPKTVLPSPRHCSKVEKRNAKGKPKCRNQLLTLNEDFTEINLCHYRSSSIRSIPSRKPGLECAEVQKRRGSIYQSSKEVRKINNIGAIEGRRKIELSQSSATAFSFGIVDSLGNSDEDSSLMGEKRSSVMSLNSDLSTIFNKPHSEPHSQEFLDLSFHPVPERVVSPDGFVEIFQDSDNRKNLAAENAERQSIEDPNFRCDPAFGPMNNCKGQQERNPALRLHKSLSATLALPISPSRSESDYSRASSPKAQFTPIRKMFDPFVKSKSQRSPLGSATEHGKVTRNGLVGIARNKTFRKSLLHNFSKTAQKECESQFFKNEYSNSSVSCSPAHLHGRLKLENKHGAPFFEFSVKSPEDVLVAKAWKVDNALNWVYTFHSLHNRRKSNASGWGLKHSNKESSMVAQMQVSCYLCTELKDAGAFDNSMVTEFVLYDILHAGKSIAAQGNSKSSPDVVKPPKGSNENLYKGMCELDEVTDQTKHRLHPKLAYESGHFNSSNPFPWPSADLRPNLEIAAIVIQAPFDERESLKCKRGDTKSDQLHPNLLDLSEVEQKNGIPDCLSPAKVHVITPSGNHSFPSTESRGPSPLLDRWRLGGGCDCSGWDMACPLVVLGNPNIPSAEHLPLLDNQRPLELFVQGTKENTPALTMAVIEEGQYAIDFHAQLSTLQAFSVCVAILHTTEASIAVGRERDKQLLQCNSLRVFIGEEVKYLIEAVTEEEKRKANKKMEEVLPSFVLNPPFSPIARA